MTVIPSDPLKGWVHIDTNETLTGISALNIEGGGCLIERWVDTESTQASDVYLRSRQAPIYLKKVQAVPSEGETNTYETSDGDEIWVKNYKLVKISD